jgi:hypothetical protein
VSAPRMIEEGRDVAEIVARVRIDRYEAERQMRLIDYAAAWQRKWDERARQTAQTRRGAYYVVGR